MSKNDGDDLSMGIVPTSSYLVRVDNDNVLRLKDAVKFCTSCGQGISYSPQNIKRYITDLSFCLSCLRSLYSGVGYTRDGDDNDSYVSSTHYCPLCRARMTTTEYPDFPRPLGRWVISFKTCGFQISTCEECFNMVSVLKKILTA